MSKQRKLSNLITEDTFKKFSCAIWQGDINCVKSLIEQGIDVNSTNSFYMEKNGSEVKLTPMKATPLMVAVQAGYMEIVKLLQDKPPSPAVLLKQSSEIVEMLVKSGASFMQLLHPQEKSPLTWATAMGQTEIVKIFLQHGASPNGVDQFGCSLLLTAAESGQAAVVKLLLDNGANLLEASSIPLIFRAAALGHTDVVEVLLGKDIGINDAYRSETLLSKAASGGHLALVKMLISKGADVNGRYSKELVPNPSFVSTDVDIPLQIAASQGEVEVVRC
jgi:ankyrin repeat protein